MTVASSHRALLGAEHRVPARGRTHAVGRGPGSRLASRAASRLYLYPSGRLWPVLAALVCAVPGVPYRGRAQRRRHRLRAPRVDRDGGTPDSWAVPREHPPASRRVDASGHEQVSVFSGHNAARLPYYDPDWTLVQLLWEQLKHSVADLREYAATVAAFWPTNRPILGPALTRARGRRHRLVHAQLATRSALRTSRSGSGSASSA